MLAYLNAANYGEIIRGLDTRASLYKKNFKEFVIKQTEYMTEVKL